MAHPPERGNYLLGTKPLVHVGFLKTWLAGALNVKVVSHAVKMVQQCKEHSQSAQPVTVYVTGMHMLHASLRKVVWNCSCLVSADVFAVQDLVIHIYMLLLAAASFECTASHGTACYNYL